MSVHKINGTIVHTEFVYPPIPIRSHDWSAVDDNYEPGCPIGSGATEQAAIDDLMEQLAERASEGTPS